MDNNSLAHSKWNCKYHIVFAPKYRRLAIYGKIKVDIGKILRKLCKHSRKKQKGNRRIYKKSTKRRYNRRSNKYERIYRSVYGWASNKLT